MKKLFSFRNEEKQTKNNKEEINDLEYNILNYLYLIEEEKFINIFKQRYSGIIIEIKLNTIIDYIEILNYSIKMLEKNNKPIINLYSKKDIFIQDFFMYNDSFLNPVSNLKILNKLIRNYLKIYEQLEDIKGSKNNYIKSLCLPFTLEIFRLLKQLQNINTLL